MFFLILPALVEFFDKMEAKKAFLKLAYTKFKNLPLYLEWAPEGSLTDSDQNSATSKYNNLCKASINWWKWHKLKTQPYRVWYVQETIKNG